MSTNIYLRVGGRKYSGWQDIHIEKSMSALCGAFQVRVIDTGELQEDRWPLVMGQACDIYIEEQLVLSGYIEDINIEYDAGKHSIVIAGRDKLGDLVDCHRAFDQKREWVDYKIVNIIKAMLAPFGFAVLVDASATVTANKVEAQFGFNDGDTVFETIRRLCRKHYIIPITYGDGKLTLTRAGSVYANDPLQSGVNVLRGGLRRSNRERFSHYYLKGFSIGFDEKALSDFTHPKGDARDQLIARYRPFVIIEDANTSFGECTTRAKAEAALRAGSSVVYEYDVAGWLQSNKNIWQINQLVRVTDPVLGLLQEDLLIDQIRFVQGAEGQITTLQLCTPEKYKAEADLEKAKSKVDVLTQLGLS